MRAIATTRVNRQEQNVGRFAAIFCDLGIKWGPFCGFIASISHIMDAPASSAFDDRDRCWPLKNYEGPCSVFRQTTVTHFANPPSRFATPKASSMLDRIWTCCGSCLAQTHLPLTELGTPIRSRRTQLTTRTGRTIVLWITSYARSNSIA